MEDKAANINDQKLAEGVEEKDQAKLNEKETLKKQIGNYEATFSLVDNKLQIELLCQQTYSIYKSTVEVASMSPELKFAFPKKVQGLYNFIRKNWDNERFRIGEKGLITLMIEMRNEEDNLSQMVPLCLKAAQQKKLELLQIVNIMQKKIWNLEKKNFNKNFDQQNFYMSGCTPGETIKNRQGNYFDKEISHPNVLISENGKTAKNGGSSVRAFVLLKSSIAQGPKRVKIDLVSIGSYVCFGVCHRSIISKNKFVFNGNQNNGFYGQQQDAAVFTHEVPSEQGQTTFTTSSGITIELIIYDSNLLIKRQGNVNSNLLTLPRDQMHDLHFCLVLYSNTDKAVICD